MTDSLASLRQLLATNTAVPGAPPPAAAPAVAPVPLSQTLTTPTKAATAVANVPKKKFNTMSLFLLSGGVLLCIYVYYKYFRKAGANATPSRRVPVAHSAERPTPQPRAPVAHSAERPTPHPSAAKRVHFDNSSNKGPTIEEIRDDSDLVASSGDTEKKGDRHVPSAQDTNPPQAGPKTADSKDPNFQALKPEEQAEDPDL